MSNSKPNNLPEPNIDKVPTDCPMEEVIATSSTHDLSHSEIELTSRDLSKNDTHTQTPINENLTNMEEDPSEPNPDKGKSPESQTATQSNLPNAIPMTVLTDIFTQTSQALNKAHKGFIPRDSFKSDLSNNEIINLLKTAFIRDSNAFKFESNVTSTYKYFTIYFRTWDSLKQYIEKSPDNLKQVKIYELTNEAINTLLDQKFANLDAAVIKIMDIPYNYDTSMLIKHLAIKTNSNNHNIYIIPGHISAKTCNTCGSPLHISQNCDDINFKTTSDNRKIYNKRFIDRKEEKITIHENHKNRYNHVISLNANKNSNSSQTNNKRSSSQTDTHNIRSLPTKSQYPRQTRQPYNKTHNMNDINNWDEPSTSTPQYQHQHTSNDEIDKRIIELEKQIQNLLNNIKTLQEDKVKTDKTIADIHHNASLMNTSLTNVNTRLDKYDSILERLTTNISLLSKKEILSTQECPRKISKKITPYDQTSYRSTKSKYNLRNNKDYNNSAEDSEFVPVTEDDTDAPDDTAMSDGAIFEGIIDKTLDEPVKNDTFTVKSYNPLNLLPSFNATR
ncbi:2525_t:CDS:2 [Rhizophagus irregularis]|nr:2525_t:CDS:2 [Rhizophagus irregularis]